MTTILFLAGLVLLVLGADLLVRGASSLASAAGIPPLVIGLTVVAFGTSAPELAVSTAATLRGEPDLALGNVVGSNIFNVLLILGLSALAAPLVVSRRLVRLEVPLLIGVSLLMLALARDGVVSRLDGATLVAGLIAYMLFLLHERKRSASGAAGAGVDDDEPARAGARPGGARVGGGVLLALLGLALLVVGSRWLVDGARSIALALGLSELVVGLTIVAAGTSLPELATSVVATLRGERDIAVGNVVGSNIFNILAILGITAVVAPDGVPAAPAALAFDMPVAIAVAVACLPIFFTGHVIARWEGGLFVAYYVAYTTYLVLSATGHAVLPAFRAAMLLFVLPLTGLTLGVLFMRGVRSQVG